MDADAILELARRAQADGQSLEAFVTDCLRRGRARRPVPLLQAPNLGVPGGAQRNRPAGLPSTAGTTALAQAAGQALQRVELSLDFFIVLVGSQMRSDPQRHLTVLRDFLIALREVWRPTPSRVVSAFLRMWVDVANDEELAFYRFQFARAFVQVFNVNPRELARWAVRLQVAAGEAGECAHVWSILSVMVAVVIAIIVTMLATVTAGTWAAVVVSVAVASDELLIAALVIAVQGGIGLKDCATALMELLKFRADRTAGLLARTWQAGGGAALATLSGLAAILKAVIAREVAQTQEQLKRVTAELLRLQVEMGDLMQALRSLQASEADVVRALRANNQTAETVARAMKRAGSSFDDIARALFGGGFPSDQAAAALAAAFGYSRMVVQNMLRALGL